MYRKLITGLLGTLILHAPAYAAQDDAPAYAVLGARIFVSDDEIAKQFYRDRFGFDWAMAAADALPGATDRPRIVLSPASSQADAAYRARSRAIVNIQVPDLWATMNALASEGVKFETEEISRNGVGLDATVLTPDGDTHYLMEIRAPSSTKIEAPQIFNLELHVSDLDRATTFYTELFGFHKRTDAFRPVMPLWHAGGEFAIVLSGDDARPAAPARVPGRQAATLLLFATDDLDRARERLAADANVRILSNPHPAGSTRRLLFADADGIVSELWELPGHVARMNATTNE